MKKKYLVWGAIATIGAILIYNWKKNQDKEDKKNEESNDVNNGTPKSESASQQNTSNTGGNTGGSTSGSKGNDDVKREDWDKPTGFTKAQGDEFRGWFNDNYPEMAKAFKLDRTGEPDNSYIRLPYWKYKGEWNKYQQSKTPSSSTTSGEVLLKSNQDGLKRIANAWGMTTRLAQLSGAPAGIFALETDRAFEGANSKGVKRYYRMFLFAQESARVKKSIWRIKEYYTSNWGGYGDLIGAWDGYFEVLPNGSISFSVTSGGTKNTKGIATNANDFIKKTTGATSYGWFGS